LISVDLPAPFGPSSASASPRSTDRSMPASARTAPKDFSTPRISMAGRIDACSVNASESAKNASGSAKA
jgi:hypothetical protein